jgi:integrative and conjugative element protein (TIGR02256 family)
MQLFQQNQKNACEAGGLLIGYLRGNHFDVRYITTPQPKDKRTWNTFERIDLKHIEILKKLKNISKGELCYIGEWHTHPEDFPLPSEAVDINEWQKIYKNRKYPLVFIIIGRKDIFIKKFG